MILVSLTVTLLLKSHLLPLISNRCISGLMSNLIKKSWTVSKLKTLAKYIKKNYFSLKTSICSTKMIKLVIMILANHLSFVDFLDPVISMSINLFDSTLFTIFPVHIPSEFHRKKNGFQKCSLVKVPH